jgi:hypothetical protein
MILFVIVLLITAFFTFRPQPAFPKPTSFAGQVAQSAATAL